MGRVSSNSKPRREGATAWRTVPRPTDWNARRQAVIDRDGCCQWPVGLGVCGSTTALEVDHIGDPADHSLENLRVLCRFHHRQRSASQGGRAAAAKRVPRRRAEEPHPGLLRPDGP